VVYSIRTVNVQAGGVAGQAYQLHGEGAFAEIWPSHGFNCLRWQIDGRDLLYVAPDWETNPVPTRSGHPILWPFPNRMRHGRFEHAGQEFQLAKNESTGQHAIHGFTPRKPWRVTGLTSAETGASIVGEFNIRKDAPDAVWPADGTLSILYTLYRDRLAVQATVRAHDAPLPFGLGYHGYFCFPGTKADSMTVRANAARSWTLDSGLPTGARPPVRRETDFRSGRVLGDAALDHLFGHLGADASDGELVEVSAVSNGEYRTSVWISAEFRELLLFTPPHRGAVAVEPYTCATDAMNLPSLGQDAGWLVLPPGGTHTSRVEYRSERMGK
jgi:aldose 1-epimerase